jgi:3-isopropylmalate/(R)-2-methylmalate dehydratase large subunit
MGMTMSEKILARHAGVSEAKAGDMLTCRVDVAACHDMFFTVAGQIDFERVSKIAIRTGAVVLLDHAVRPRRPRTRSARSRPGLS